MGKIKLLLGALILLVSGQVSAAMIEFDLDYTLGPISGEFKEGQTLSGVSTFFPDDAFYFGLGDTLVFNILFDQRLQVFEFYDPPGSTNQYFSFGLDCGHECPQPNGGFNGTWTSTIEALGGRGNIWSDPITLNWSGGGAGFGWGGAGLEITDSQGSFSGIRWTTAITSINQGWPLYLSAFTGVQMGADGIRINPVPIPAAIWLFGTGLIGLIGFSKRRKAA